MIIEQLAEARRLKLSHITGDGSLVGDSIIAGKLGHLYQHSNNRFGVIYLGKSKRAWGNARRKLEARGLNVYSGDTEGYALFDSDDKLLVTLALSVIKARPKRKVSPEQVERFRAMAKSRRMAKSLS